MKKLIAILLMLSTLILLPSCGEETESGNSPGNGNKPSSTGASTGTITGSSGNSKGNASASKGLEFIKYDLEEEGLGSFGAVIGIGTCTDTDIVIPAVYDGVTVTTIAGYAFSGCTNIRSITIPSSVVNIGVGTFMQCNNLTDVYYAGTKAQWEEVNINSDNEPLTSATIHYNAG